MRSHSAGRSARRLRAIAAGLLPQELWRRILRWGPLKTLQNRLAGPSDASHLAEGIVRFESLTFDFAAPYHTWIKARRRGIENRICRLVMTRCREGSVGIDVGANAGFISLVMALSVRPSGRVLSFEADAGLHDVLQRNIRTNGLESVCTPVQAFVSESSRRDRHVSLDEAASSHNLSRLDFLKIDVDGGDLDVLRGARELLRRWRPVVVVEMAANQGAIYSFLKEEIGYPTLVGMSGEACVPGQWPVNLIAGDGPIAIPPRGHFS